MEYTEHVEAIEREVQRIEEAAAVGALTDPSPTCPAFTKRELVVHIGEFMGFWTHLLCEGTGRTKTPFSELDDQDPTRWLGDLGGHMLNEFALAASDQHMWTWHPDDQTAAFAARRACHELTIHRVDLEAVSGPAGPVEAAVAADGIDEVAFLAKQGLVMGYGNPGGGETLHLHGTDVESAEWLVHLGADDIVVTHEHAKADLAIRGSVSDLEMLLYQRPVLGTVEFFGDESVLDAFYNVFTFSDENDD